MLLLILSTYISIESLIFQYNFKETIFLVWILIAIIYFLFLFFILFCLIDFNIIKPIFSNNKNFSKKINFMYDKIFGYKIFYITPLLINIILIFLIKSIDIHFTNYENKVFIKKQIEDDGKIKEKIIIDKLLKKVDIVILDEEIEKYNKEKNYEKRKN